MQNVEDCIKTPSCFAENLHEYSLKG